MTKLNVSADLLAAVALCSSTEETRYYLNGVFVTPAEEGVLLVATDGHALALAHDPEGHAEREAIVTCEFKSKVLKTARRDLSARRVAIDLETEIGTVEGHGVLRVEEIEATFPDFWRVIPSDMHAGKTTAGIEFNLDGKLLNQITQSCQRAALAYSVAAGDATRVCYSAASAADPAIGVPMECAIPMMWVAMPFRGRKAERPAWAHPPVLEAAE